MRPIGSRAGFALAICLSSPVVLAGIGRTPEWVEEARPDLLELTVRSELVVHGRVEDGRMRHPLVVVLEVLHGDFPDPVLHVVFRHLNRMREPGEDPIQFQENREMILFLQPHQGSGRPDRFELVRERFGKLDLPPEGADAYLEAIRIFAELAAAPPSEHFPRTLALLESGNLLVASTALRQVNKHNLTTGEQVPILLRFIRQGREPDRILAAEAFESLLARTRRTRQGFDRESDIIDLLVAAARTDPSVAVRSAAVGALQAWASPQAVEALEIIAATDSSQTVRFKAELSLLRIRRRVEQAIP